MTDDRAEARALVERLAALRRLAGPNHDPGPSQEQVILEKLREARAEEREAIVAVFGTPQNLNVRFSGHDIVEFIRSLGPAPENRDAGGYLVRKCGKSCDHDSPCTLPADHDPADRHETDHGCTFYDARGPAPEKPPPADPVASWPTCTVCGKSAREGKHAFDLGEGHEYVPAPEPTLSERRAAIGRPNDEALQVPCNCDLNVADVGIHALTCPNRDIETAMMCGNDLTKPVHRDISKGRVAHSVKVPPREVEFEKHDPAADQRAAIVEAAKGLLEGLQALREDGLFGCPFCLPEPDGSHEKGCRTGALIAAVEALKP